MTDQQPDPLSEQVQLTDRIHRASETAAAPPPADPSQTIQIETPRDPATGQIRKSLLKP